ncbi:(2Fe-2S)-binding protein [Pseudomonas sp.]
MTAGPRLRFFSSGIHGSSRESKTYKVDRYCKCDEFVFIIGALQPASHSLHAMIVCVCRRVSDREIARHARAGMTFDEVQFELGVATQCGRCETCARDVVAQCSASHPVAAIHREDGLRTIQLAKSIQESNAWNSSGLSLAA